MVKHKIMWGVCCALSLALAGCSRQQSDWQKTRETNTADAYEQFLKKYPSGEFTPQAQARVKELYEERDWQKARDLDTPEAYQAFLKEYPEGKWTEEARIRVENFTLAQSPSGTAGQSVGTEAQAPEASTPPSVSAASAAPPAATPPAKVVKHADASPAAPAAPAAAHNTAGAKSTGQFAVQLGAFKAGAGAAKVRWAELQKKYPAAMAGLSSSVLPMRSSGGSLYRLQAVGLSEQHARDVCGALKAKSEPCLVIPPSPG